MPLWIIHFLTVFVITTARTKYSISELTKPPDYVLVRPYRQGVIKWLWARLWRPVLCLIKWRWWWFRVGAYSTLIYRELGMPAKPTEGYIELGTFKPADSTDLVRIVTDRRIWEYKQVLGSSVWSYANKAAMEKELFHTYADFMHQQKQHDTPTRAEGISFGHSLDGFERDKDGYLKYLKTRARDVWEFLQRDMTARIPISAFQKHMYSVGMTGAGKSEMLKPLIAKLKENPRATVIVIDPERKLAEEVARSKEHRSGDNLIFFDPKLGRQQNRFPIINPFDFQSDDLTEEANYAQAFVRTFKEAADTDLTSRMMTLLKPCVQVLLRRPKSTLADLQRFLDVERCADLVALGREHPRPEVREFFATSFLRKDWQRTKDPLMAKLQDLRSTPTFSDCVMGQSSLRMEDIITSHKTVVLTLDQGALGIEGSEMLGRFFVSLLEATIRRMRDDSDKMADPDPVYLVVDEFQQFVTETFGEILVRARKLGLHLIAAQQYVGQGMSPEFLKTIRNNTNIKAIGLYTEPAAAKTAADMIGIEKEELYGLGNGKFLFKVGNKPAVSVQMASDRLGHGNAMTNAQWQHVTQDQLTRYYREAGSFDQISNSETPAETPQEALRAPQEDVATPTQPDTTKTAESASQASEKVTRSASGHPRYKRPKSF